MNNDTSNISDEVFFSSLSKRMQGEIHFDDECKVITRYGELNEHGRIVVVFIRKCRCGKYPNKETLIFGTEERLILPKDGVDVHKDESCEYVPEKYFDKSIHRHVYRFQLTCYCASRSKQKRILEYN